MIQQKKKICKSCSKVTYIWSKGSCKTCSARLKLKSNSKLDLPKKNSKKPLFPLDTEVKEKEGNQYDMFLEIWNERERVSEITGKNLVEPEHKMFTWQFEHILPKGTYPDLKFDKKNIMLLTWQEHFDLTNNTATYKEDPLYKKYFDIKEKAKEDYYKLKDK